ncbi:hypothetical protein NKJ09_22050 [Mesorhizobium sp. M0189]|uniref:hypothetical protein n=1 Tax=unclassified Mesorhizobium TaxID=325217 RepID=UPI00333605A5
MLNFEEILTRTWFEVPEEYRKFAHRESPPFQIDWDYYAYCYAETFEAISKLALSDKQDLRRYAIPLFYLGRHSMELALKAAIVEFAEYTQIPAQTAGHNLLELFDTFVEQWEATDFPNDNGQGWESGCREIIRHVQGIDPKNDRFRYPTDLKGNEFEYTRVELEGLVGAHKNITDFCRISVGMLNEMLEA